MGRAQWCWAHLKRDFQALIDHPDQTVIRLGRDLMRPTKELFRLWAPHRDGTLTRRDFERLMRAVRKRIEGLLLRGVFSGNAKLTGMCGPLYDHPGVAVDVRGSGRRRADEQRERAGVATGGDLAEAVVRDAE